MHMHFPLISWSKSVDILFLVIGLSALFIAVYAWFSHYYGDEWRACGWRTCVTENDDVIQVGRIATRGSETFKHLMQERMQSGSTVPVVVRVDSVGGDFGEAMAMTEALRSLEVRRPVRIEVLARGRCESMCTVLWTAASTRVAAPGARFMFHAPRRPLGGSAGHFAGTATETEAMRQAIGGVDPALLAELERRGAFAAIPIDVPLTAAEIAALGGEYLRLDPALR